MDECAAAMVLMRLSCSPHSPRWEGKESRQNVSSLPSSNPSGRFCRTGGLAEQPEQHGQQQQRSFFVAGQREQQRRLAPARPGAGQRQRTIIRRQPERRCGGSRTEAQVPLGHTFASADERKRSGQLFGLRGEISAAAAGRHQGRWNRQRRVHQRVRRGCPTDQIRHLPMHVARLLGHHSQLRRYRGSRPQPSLGVGNPFGPT